MTGTEPASGLVLRPMQDADLDPLTDLWAQGWRDGHVAVVPPALTRLRTRENFRERLDGSRDIVHVSGPVGAPDGFVRLKADELDQFYVDPAQRGTGLAQRLMTAAEAILKAQGHRDVWLSCSVGNDRAARFYEKCGWRNVGVRRIGAETSEGPFEMDVWRFEKAL